MSDFIPLPKRNVWRALFDIRPGSIVLEPRGDTEAFVDLRVMPPPRMLTARTVPAQEIAMEADARPRFGAARAVLRKAVIALGAFAFFGAFLWGGNAGRAYIESRKADVFAAGRALASHAERGMSLMTEMRFDEAEREFRLAADELERFEGMMGPALFAAFLSAKVLPENDYVKTALMLRDAKSVMIHAADLGNIAGRVIERAPSALFEGDAEFLHLMESVRTKLIALGDALAGLEIKRNAFSDSIAGEWFSGFPEKKIALQEAAESFGFLEDLLGVKSAQTFLLLFQNPAEIRATGGFVGSYGILEMQKGKIANFRVDDIYNPDGQLDELILPPRPLQYVTPVWEARDANWFFDFALSAKKTASLLEKTTGSHFDVVIALNPQMIAELIDIVGPVEMPEYGKIITGENFWEEAQYQTRAGEDRKINQPKRFLTIFGPRLLEKLKTIDSRSASSLSDIFSQGLREKSVLLWAKDPELQAFIEKRDWGGKVSEVASDEDYLAIVLSNIGGAKADYVMRQNYHLQTTIEPSGNITNTLRITRTHEGDRAIYPWWKARNVTYIRVFVPKGSVLLGVSGNNPEPRLIEIKNIEKYSLDPDVATTIGAAVRLDKDRVDIFEESRRTVFGFWHVINPGQSKTITVEWQLPFKAGFAPPHYALTFQKQSGVSGVFQHAIELPRGSKVLSVEPFTETLKREALGERFSWVGEDMTRDIRHAISYQLR